MKLRLSGAVLAAAAFLATLGPAQAQNFGILDGSKAPLTMCSRLIAGTQVPCQLVMGLFGVTPTAINETTSGALDVTPVALPPGAATAAKQPALGTAGTPSADVLTVQGAASMTALKVDGSAVTQPVSGSLTNISGTISLPTGAATAANQASVIGTKAAGTAAANSLLVGGVYNSAGVTLTNGQQASAQLDASGRLITNCGTGCASATPWTPSGQAAVSITAGTSSSSTALTSPGPVIVVINDGPGTIGVRVTNGPSTALLTDTRVLPGSYSPPFANPGGTVNVNVISSAASTNVRVESGSGTYASGLAVDASKVSLVSIDQTTPGTTNGVRNDNSGATGSAVPARADYMAANSGGLLTGIIQADSSAAINVSTATTTQLVALSSGKKIYVTSLDVIAGGTGNITFEYGTGANCGTGTTVLTGAYNLTAQAGIAKGNGLGPVLVVPASNALCVLTSAAVQMSGSVAYTQF